MSCASRLARLCSSDWACWRSCARLALGVRKDFVGLFLRVEKRLLATRVGIPLGIADDAERLFLGAADRFGRDTLSIGHPDSEHRARGDEGEYDADEITGYRQHA